MGNRVHHYTAYMNQWRVLSEGDSCCEGSRSRNARLALRRSSHHTGYSESTSRLRYLEWNIDAGGVGRNALKMS